MVSKPSKVKVPVPYTHLSGGSEPCVEMQERIQRPSKHGCLISKPQTA